MRKLLKCVFILVVLAVWSGCAIKKDSAFSTSPPDPLQVHQVPQFIIFGFDDNGFSGLEDSGGTGGVRFILDLFGSRKNPPGIGNKNTYDGVQTHFSLYCLTRYIEDDETENPVYIKRAWREAVSKGHELGVHGHSHKHGMELSVEEWKEEIQTCIDWLTKPFDPEESINAPDKSKGIGMALSSIHGFRTPYLEYNKNTFDAVSEMNFLYDCSIEEGYQDDQDGANFFWPYKLDKGSHGNDYNPISDYPELWEIPVYVFIVPPDDLCEKYGVAPGLREKMKRAQNYFNEEDGKITGADWNLWIEFGMTKAEFLATLKYSLDLRLTGNRCPLTFVGHSDIYSSKYFLIPQANLEERQQAIEEFIDYALTKPAVRIVSAKELLDWILNPYSLKNQP